MTDITIPRETLEKAARRAVLFNGGDPDKKLRLTPHGVTVTQWEQVAPLIEAACLAMLRNWPGMRVKTDDWCTPLDVDIILPLTENSNDKG